MAEKDTQPTPTPKKAEPRVSPHDAAITKWFEDSFHGSVVSRDTEVYNHVRASVDKLRALIGGNL